MKILIVHHDKGIDGGAEEVVRQLRRYLIDKWHAVQVIYELSPTVLWAKTQQLLPWADVVSVHNFPATLAAYPTKQPIVWMCNEPPELFTNWRRKPIEAFNRHWVKRSGMKVVVADGVNARRFERIYGVCPTIIPYGVNYDFWSQGERNENGFTLLQVGHSELFEKGKGIFNRIREHIPDAKLMQVWGASHVDVREEYYKASVLIHPIGDQGGWLVPFEAMCAGLPVVVSSEFTGWDVIMDNELGVVTDDIVKSVVKGAHKGVGIDRVKEWVRQNLSWSRFGESMVSVFKEAMLERTHT